MEASLKNLNNYLDKTSVDDLFQMPSSDEISTEEDHWNEGGHNSSPFYSCFEKIAQQNYGNFKDSQNNFFNEEYLQLILTKYMASYFPL